MSAEAWIVECAGCKCLIVACGIDPQDEHGQPHPAVTPLKSAVLNCPCCNGDYRYAGDSIIRGRPKRNAACLRRNEQPRPKQDGAVVIAASIVAAIRLRGEPIARSPKVCCDYFRLGATGQDGDGPYADGLRLLRKQNPARIERKKGSFLAHQK